MAWHSGHPLSQTLLTSIYIDALLWPEPKRLEDATFDRKGRPNTGHVLVQVVLRAYCLATVKACDLVLSTISKELYYEVSKIT
jgi:hypothetical protein